LPWVADLTDRRLAAPRITDTGSCVEFKKTLKSCMQCGTTPETASLWAEPEP
jgi:hypothetical protein